MSFYEWKTYLLSKNSNPLQILQFPKMYRVNHGVFNQIEPTRAHAPDPKSGGEIAMRFGEVTWTDLPHDKTINDYSFVVGCDGLEDMDALNPQIIIIYYVIINKNSKTIMIIIEFFVILPLKLHFLNMKKTSTTTYLLTSI